jgi:hypothetical protein
MLPILILVALGYGVQKRLQLDLVTLSKLQVHVLIPCAILYFLMSAQLPLKEAWPSLLFTLFLFAAHFTMGWLVGAAVTDNASLRALLGLATAFPNSGNYGIPLIQLTMPADFLLHQTVVLSVHMAVIATFGIWLLSLNNGGGVRQSFWSTLIATPMLPAVAAGFLLKGFEVKFPPSLSIPLRLMGEAFTPIALFLLGAQLSAIQGFGGRGIVTAAVALKLAAAPAVAFGLALLAGFPDSLAAFFALTSTIPTGVMLTVFAAPYPNAAGFVAAVVFFGTVFSAVTVALWIYGLKLAGYLPSLN